MNQTKPTIPPGSVLEQKSQSQARFRFTVSCVFAAHFVFLGALLMQGCKREDATTPAAETALTSPAVDTNMPPPDLTQPPGSMPPTAMTATPPVPAAPVPPLAPGAGTEYTVVRGDSFYAIGKKFNVPMKAIADANPTVDPNKLQPGQKLTIPTATASATTAPGVSTTNAGTGEIEYTVKSGDNLTRIATQHGTTVNAIRAANNLTTDRIRVGQKLKIPAKTAVPPAAPMPATTPTP